jgi:MFS transporter, DHA1 family, tetracycline resistance protein
MSTDIYKKSFPVLILTTLLNTVGIGILIPVFPFLIEKYTGNNASTTALYTGIIISLYAFCEFVAAPTLGALSDKYGRRPILMYSLLGSAIGYVLLGIGGALWVLILGRIIDGISAGNISTIFAYVADITEPQDRGKNYGIIGGTLGLGFMIGPAIGGFVAKWGLSAPMYLAAAITFINLIWAYFALPESVSNLDKTKTFSLKSLNPIGVFYAIASNVFLRTILFASLFHFIAFAQLQGNGTVLLKDALQWSPATIGLGFLIVGAVDIFVQGFLIDKLLPMFGEKKLSVIGLSIAALAYITFALAPSLHSNSITYIGLFAFAFGTGLFEPAMASMVSQSAAPQEQGLVQGAYQSLQSLSRVIGPLTAAFLYSFNWSAPYVAGIIITAISVLLFLRLKMPATINSERAHNQIVKNG